jgi:hypothetical protein
MLPERTSGRYLSIKFCCARGHSQFEPLVDLKDVHRASGPWGPWNGIMPDGAPILVRDTSTQEIYALDVQWP